ncbi:uncharacterized protein ACLA_087430 [Aspergillus clavatus NRRL 1]|uniref:Phosphoglycerate mutase family protein n=1 Tax=Aspergillus clavatus (strain ATCC 1007 / CBS 513.65 / DSM 816 / NCTC 3887 / NRRL 1 / QM 1276 / 107) TaxID=344612 RepID=A1CUQ1_ASPCL|nr:phosphoglycerate mutase family protein [Aspergillus clavatus NRRL 1]EAW07038.1 phosphoglycerate mutase family protein [Aspergillus clavatus NRRL 1]
MGKLPAAIFIARHGARLDAADKNWHLTSPTPYDTPLSYGGWLQSRALGARIVSLLQSLDDTPAVSSTASLDEPSPSSSLPKPKKKRRVIVHTSPYLRCVQTSIAVSSGISQHYPDTEVINPAVASSSSHQVNGYSTGSPVDPSRESVSTSTPVPGIPPTYPPLDHRCLLRVDAFLGEWLTPEYFEQITPPPKSERLIAAAKAELLRRGDDVVPVADTVNTTPTGYFPGGWSGFTTSITPPPVDESTNQVAPTAGIPAATVQRNRANSYDSLKSAENPYARRVLGKINTDLPPIPDGAYMPPTPSYAISPSGPIPIGYVTHARSACVKVDYQWDSMRDPQNWGHGGEYGEEWSAMHERFRAGLERMLGWYREPDPNTSTGRPRRFSHQPGVHGDVRQDAEEEDDVDTIVIIITHGAGCNALVGALTGDPVLLDFKTASLTMAVRKDNVDEQSDARAVFLSGEPSVLRTYSLRLVASTDHLRPHVKPVPSTSTRSSPSSSSTTSAAAPSYRNRVASRASLSQGQFMVGPSPISGLGSRSWSLVRPSTAPRGSSGLWSSSSLIEESADDILPNFGDRRSISTGAAVTAAKTNGDAHPPKDSGGWANPLPHRSLSQRGLWGSPPISKEREAGTKRRWTVTERRVDV